MHRGWKALQKVLGDVGQNLWITTTYFTFQKGSAASQCTRGQTKPWGREALLSGAEAQTEELKLLSQGLKVESPPEQKHFIISIT